ncbi:MAG: hypothetical protein ACRDB3_16655 [Citrobacter telavivensis]
MAFSMTTNPMKESQRPQFAGTMKKQLGAFSPHVSEVTVSGKKMQRLPMTSPVPIIRRRAFITSCGFLHWMTNC